MIRKSSGIYHEKPQSAKIPIRKNRGGKNYINNQVLMLRKHIVSQVSSYFPIGDNSVTQT